MDEVGVGGGREGGEVDGLCQSRVLRAPEHSSRGARARVRTCQRARATLSTTAREASCRLDARLR
jgi:hypothetical protein